jgi:nucleolin
MGTEEDARKLFVAGLPDTVTDEGLRALFTSTGAGIDELSLPRDRATGRPRGFAFVTLSTADDAQRAREQLDGSLMEGRSISVRPFSSGPPGAGRSQPGFGGAPAGGQGGGGGRRSKPPPRDDSNRTLYVGNLPYDIEEGDLRGIFNQMGAQGLDRIHLPMDHATGRKRGFAFVSFVSEDAAKAGLDAVGDLNIRGRQCTVHIAHPRGERPARPERPAFGGGPSGGFGGPSGGFGGPSPTGMRSSPPPAMGGGGRNFGPPASPGGRPINRRPGEDGDARGAKGASRKTRLMEEKRRGGGNARRYMDDVDDDE